jgi:hypothetical protein
VRSAPLLWYAGDIKCLNVTDPDQLNSFMQCRMQLAQCRRTPIVIWALGWLFLAGFSWLPCFYFCCCAKEPPPAYGDPYAQNGVQVGVLINPAKRLSSRCLLLAVWVVSI